LTEKHMTRAELIKWLGEAIEKEVSKPFEEINYDFVDACGCLLDELMDENLICEDDVAKAVSPRAAKILANMPMDTPKVAAAKATEKRRILPSFGKKKRCLARMLTAAALVLCIGVVTIAAVPALRSMVLDVLQMDVGQSVSKDGVTYIYLGGEKEYTTVDELLEAEGFIIRYPQIKSDSLYVSAIIKYEENNQIVFVFNDTSISYEVWLNNTDILPYMNNATKYTFNLYETYVIEKNHMEYYTYTVIDDTIHHIVSNNLETIGKIIQSIS